MTAKVKTGILMFLFITFTVLVLMPTPSQSKTYKKGKEYTRTHGGHACECPNIIDTCTCVLTDPSGR